MTAQQTLDYFSILYGVKDRKYRVESLIKELELTSFKNRSTKLLSGGERQRLVLALALIHNPDVVFLDEPSTGLDPDVRIHIWDYIKKLHDEGKPLS